MSRRVWVVEDDEDDRKILVKILSLDGEEVEAAADGRQALDKARWWKPDLILMDLALPRLDGWEATRQLKADPRLREITVVALTAFAMRDDEKQARDAGCDDYIPKPARPAEIRGAVAKYLR